MYSADVMRTWRVLAFFKAKKKTTTTKRKPTLLCVKSKQKKEEDNLACQGLFSYASFFDIFRD